MQTQETTIAGRVAEQTEIRRALLRNGYSCFPCAGKTKQMHRWQAIKATEALIDDWADQLKWVSTAVHVGPGRLIGLDLDIDDADVLGDFKRRVPAPLWQKLQASPVRYGGGVKEMLFARLREGEQNVPKFVKTGQWGPEGGPDHKVELFLKPHQLLAIDGARLVDDHGTITSEYRWRDAGLHSTPLEALPELTMEDVRALADAAVAAFQAAGWDRLDTPAPGTPGQVVYDLKRDQTFTAQDGEVLTVPQLIDACGAVGTVDLWSWLPGHHNRGDRCHAFLHRDDGGLCIRDHHTEVIHRLEGDEHLYRKRLSEDIQATMARLGEKLEGLKGRLRERAQAGDEKAAVVLAIAEEAEAEEDAPRKKKPVQLFPLAPERTLDAVCEVLAADPDIFDLGDSVALVVGHEIRSPNMWRMLIEMERRIDLFEVVRVDPPKPRGRPAKNKKPKPAPPPAFKPVRRKIEQNLPLRFMSLGGDRGLKRLTAVITAPLVLPDGRLLKHPGFDTATGLLLRPKGGEYYDLSETPTLDEARAAYSALWAPFELFPLDGPGSRSAVLAAVLAAVARPGLPTCPAFGSDAPTVGNGKTLLAEAIGTLAAGGKPKTYGHVAGRDDEEMRKRVTTMLRQGHRAVVLDNITGTLDSATLAAMLTAETMTDRILGASEEVTLPSRTWWAMTGNNLTLSADLARRVLTARIDSMMEVPIGRAFDFCPKQVVTEYRDELAVAACTLMRARFTIPFTEGKGRTASFEAWDTLIRQTVLWCREHLDPDLADPMDAMTAAVGADPESEALGALLEGLERFFPDGKWFTVAEAMRHAHAGIQGNLAPLLADLMPMNKTLTNTSVGRVLNYRCGRIVDGRRLERGSKTKAGVPYRVARV
jgi:hypothetical protein